MWIRRLHRNFAQLLVCCMFTVFSVAMVFIHNKRLFSPHIQQNAPTVVVERSNSDLKSQHSSENKFGRSQILYHAQDVVKSVFNFGEFMRGHENDDEKSFHDLSIEEIAMLKSQNLCPEPYRLSTDFVKEHAKITHISNWTIAKNQSNYNGANYATNVSLVNEIIDSKPRIVILTPISNAAENLQHYFKLLCSISYPHHLISIVLGEDSSKDPSFELAHVHLRTLKQYFSRTEVLHFNDEMFEISHFGKHDEFFQLKRRGHMARSRNQLLFRGLNDEDYVMWMDVDVKYIPRDIVQHLLSANKDVIVPSCMFQTPDGSLDIYDRNSWRETKRSQEFLRKQNSDYLKLEGYTQSMRDLLPNIKSEGHIVSIDGVGGCVMLIKSDCHRKGLIFPPFIFQHHIETEGLAKMAKAMDYGVFGYPMVYVCHW